MLRPFRSIVATLALTAVAGCIIVPPRAGVVYVDRAPPMARVEVVTVAPPGRVVWIGGNWAWHRNDYVWVPGRWQPVPDGYREWVAGRWAHERSGWFWVEGRWR